MRIAFATDREYARLHDDDRTLLAPLAELGVDAEPAIWNDPKVRWSEFDGVLIRTIWDYYRSYPDFLAWVALLERSTRLWNPPPLVRWNSHKSYLLDLAAQGIRIVPTRVCLNFAAAVDAARRAGWRRAVVKGAVSAGGYRTYRLDTDAEGPLALPSLAEPPVGDVLVQPYLDEVEQRGERSLVFLDGEYSHAFARAPRLGGGSALEEGAPVRASAAELVLAERTLAAAPARALYGRVDTVVDGSGAPCVMELEVIEPLLRLANRRGAADRLAAAIAKALRAPRPAPPSGTGAAAPTSA